jgi:hypothetical protein
VASTSPNDSERALRAIVILMLVGLGGVFLFAAQAGSLGQYFGVVGVAAMVAGAALLAGGLLGFLFGIPRTQPQVQEPAEAEEGEESSEGRMASYQANTNLEQISDWLTKILVGVGLTQLASLPDWLNRYSVFISDGLGGFDSSSLFGVALLGYFLVCGFLIGYLWTRLYMAGALRQADISILGARMQEVTSKVDEIERQNRVNERAMNLVQRQLAPIPGTKPVSLQDLTVVTKQASDTTKAQIFYLAQGVRSDNWRDHKDKMELTIPVFRALIASDEDDRYHANHGQLGFALKDKGEPEWAEAEAELTRAINLRGKARKAEWREYEFNRAVCRINQEAGFKDGKPSDDPARQGILEDLWAACQEGRVANMVRQHPDVIRWRKLNKVKWPVPPPSKAPQG